MSKKVERYSDCWRGFGQFLEHDDVLVFFFMQIRCNTDTKHTTDDSFYHTPPFFLCDTKQMKRNKQTQSY